MLRRLLMPLTNTHPSLRSASVIRSRHRALLTTAVSCLLVIPFASCGITSPAASRLIMVDSLTVSPSAALGEFRVRAHG